MHRFPLATVVAVGVLLLARPAASGDDKKGDLPKDGPGDPALTYDVVAKDPTKYVGKRVAWPALATTGSGKEAAFASNPDVKDARKYKMYAARFGSEKELRDAFFAGRGTLTGTVAGTLEIAYEVSGPGGDGKEKRKQVVPLLVRPRFDAGKR